MLGDVVELTVVVRDIDAAIERYTKLFGLTVHHRGESKEFGFKNAILPLGRSATSSSCSRPTRTRPSGASSTSTARASISSASSARTSPARERKLTKAGVPASNGRGPEVAWVHPQDTHGLFVELRKRESYT